MSKGSVTPDTIAASTGICTLCIKFADKLDPSNVWKGIIIFGAPTNTLIAGWVWSAAKNQIFLAFDDYNSRKTFEKAQQLLADAKARGADDGHMTRLTEIMSKLEKQKKGVLQRSSADHF